MKLNGNNIFWDLDGVLRNLTYNFTGSPFTQGEINGWSRTNSNGDTVVEHIEKNLHELEDAPKCEYFDLAMMFNPIHIVSCQPDTWRHNTNKWLDKYIPEAKIKYLNNPDHKLLYLESGRRVLIEDYPFFTDYTHVILVDRPWNQDAECGRRIKSPEELMIELRRFLDGKC